MSRLADLRQAVSRFAGLEAAGEVISVRGPTVQARVPAAAIGDLCLITGRDGAPIPGQVISFQGDTCALAPFGSVAGLAPGCEVRSTGQPLRLPLSATCPGQVVDALGYPLGETRSMQFGRGELDPDAAPPSALERTPICRRLETGVRAIDGVCPLGYGQRIGLFAPAGIGKSTLLAMIARNASVDVPVVALIGERGREVNEFLREALGTEGLRRAIVVVATSDESALRRMLAARTATAIAEYHRAHGRDVLLLLDSLTRAARAMREVGLAAGEVPVRHGYTPSVYAELPRLLERAGTAIRGSITGIYTVLTAGEGEVDPLGEEVRSILDGHLVLDSRLAQAGVRPAIDLTSSVSRLLPALTSPLERESIAGIVRLLARVSRDRDLALLGGVPDAELARALTLEPELRAILTQSPGETLDRAALQADLAEIARRFQSTVGAESPPASLG